MRVNVFTLWPVEYLQKHNFACCPKKYVYRILCFGVSCHGFMLVSFNHTLQGYITGAGAIEPSHKPHTAPVPYPTMYHFVTEMCAYIKNGALWDMGLVHWGIYATDLLFENQWSNPDAYQYIDCTNKWKTDKIKYYHSKTKHIKPCTCICCGVYCTGLGHGSVSTANPQPNSASVVTNQRISEICCWRLH